jgi:TorA maturation chaperone TorD
MSGPTFTKTQSEPTELLARSFFYRLLSALFRHPGSGELREEILESRAGGKEALKVLGAGRGAEDLTGHLQLVFKTLRGVSHREWAEQYEQCFGHTANSKVPAYELEYGEEHSHRQPQELADITAFYQAFGLQVSQREHERADHISVECEFMGALVFKEAYALNSGEEEHASITREASQQFLSEHLSKWLPAFAYRLSKFAGKGLMRWIADLALCFIITECRTQEINCGNYDLPVRAIQETEETGCTTCQYGPAANKAALGTS